MLNVTINVFSTLGSNVVTVVPASGDNIGIVYIGLMGQRHYVGLDPVPTINDTNSVADIVSSVPPNTNNNNPDNNNDTLADGTIEEGDEHIRQITGGAPITSVLSSDDPEVEAQICSVAPAEGNRPIDIVRDKYFEELSNPTKFPYGEGGFNTDRNCTITLFSSAYWMLITGSVLTWNMCLLVNTELKASKYAMTPTTSYFGRGLIANSLPAKLETKQW